MQILKNFIVLEGLDGAGTTTQSKLLSSKLNAFWTCEPSNAPTGTFIREILQKKASVHPMTLARLFVADRFEHLYGTGECSVCKQLEQNNTVICDRYIFSSLAYQSLACDFDEIYKLNANFPLPEVVFFIDTNIEECQNRINSRDNDKELFEKIEIQNKILTNYKKALKLFENETHIFTLDGNLTADEILQNELNILSELNIAR